MSYNNYERRLKFHRIIKMKLFAIFIIIFFKKSAGKTILDPNDYKNYENLKTIKEMEKIYLKESDIDSDLDKVSFMLYTSETKRDYLEFDINTDPQILLNHGFDVDKMTKFVAHGWVATGLEVVPPFAEGLYYWCNINFYIKRFLADKVPL